MELNRKGVVPVAAGVNTDWDKPQLPLGVYSEAFNVRLHGPGFRLRPGLTRHHTTDLGKVLSMFSYGSGEKFYIQDSIGDVYEATDEPPATTAGAFGTIVVDESALDTNSSGQVLPASWNNYREHIVFSEGSIQHLVNPGVNAKPLKVIFKAATSVFRIQEGGLDITDDVIDPESAKTSQLLTFTVANEDALYICTEFPATDFIFDIENVPAGTKTMGFYFHNGDVFVNQTTGITDGTSAWASDGTYVATMAGRATDGTERPTVMFGTAGYWYRFELGSDDATPDVSFNSILYEGDFRPIENVMVSIPEYCVEVQVETAAGEYETYGASTVVVSELAIGDYIYFATQDMPWALYISPGGTPNTSGSTVLTAVEVWTGAAFTAVTLGTPSTAGSVEDSTNGFANPGFISWDRTDVTPAKRAFNNSLNHMYWCRIKFDTALSAGCIIAASALVYKDIAEFGQGGKVSTVWKDRGVFTFSKFSRDLYISKKYRLNVLNGDDFAILTPGDGRWHDVTAMLPFFNELMVFQEEKGTVGGCITLFEGYSPETYGKLVLSTRLGTFSQQSVCIIDGSTDTTRTTDVTQTQVAFISKYGVYLTEGRTIKMISQPIANYFDPEKSTYIQTDFDAGDCPHWIAYDRANNCLRLGIRTIASTTDSPDVYPVFHLDTNEWTFDKFPNQSITAFVEVTAASGNVDSLQYAAGIDLLSTTDLVYRCVAGQDYDETGAGVKDAITGELRMEFSDGPNYLNINELSLRASSAEDYTLTKKVYENGVLDTTETQTFNMDADGTYLTYRERILENMQLNHHFSLYLSWENTADPASWNTGPVLYDFIHEILSTPNLD